MRRLGTIVLIAALGAAAYQAWANTRIPHRADDEAAAIACSKMAGCSGLAVTPTKVDTSSFVREYTFETGDGPLVVRCRFAFLLWGEPRCTAELERSAAPTPDQERYPHQLDRGAPES